MNYLSYILFILNSWIAYSYAIPSPLSDLTINVNIRGTEGVGRKSDQKEHDYIYDYHYPEGLAEFPAKGPPELIGPPEFPLQNELDKEGPAENPAKEGPEEGRAEGAAEGSAEGCFCGIPNRKNKHTLDEGLEISHGKPTEPHEYPWQVAIIHKKSNKLTCGGSIIGSSTILTAQHCTENIDPGSIEILVGEHNMDWDGDGEMTYRIKEVINYNKKFKFDRVQIDFALIILNKEITWSNITKPICLPEGNPSSYEDEEAVVTGWGSTFGIRANTTIPSPILKEAKVQTMNKRACAESKTIVDLNTNTEKNITGLIIERALCAFDPIESPCVRDSGGPLITEEEDGYYAQIGVVSWGYDHPSGICRSNEKTPGLYSRVTSQVTWIKEHMEGKTCPTKKNEKL